MGDLAGILRDLFFRTHKIERLKYFGENFGAFFVRKFVAQGAAKGVRQKEFDHFFSFS